MDAVRTGANCSTTLDLSLAKYFARDVAGNAAPVTEPVVRPIASLSPFGPTRVTRTAMKISALTCSNPVAFLRRRVSTWLLLHAARLEGNEAILRDAELAGSGHGVGRSSLLMCGAAGLVATWLVLGGLHAGNSSDSLIPTFVSLYRWKWFYWMQNRYGMLTALLAMPVRHPFMNLLFQNWMAAFSGLMVFPLSSAYLLGWRNASLPGLVAAAIFVLTASMPYHADYFVVQPYAVSTFLGLVGLLVMESSGDGAFRSIRGPLCAILYFLSLWVSLAAVFVILPLFVLRWIVVRARESNSSRQVYAGLLLIMAPAVINWQIAVRYPGARAFGWTAPQSWAGNSGELLMNVYKLAPPAFLIALVALFGIGMLASSLHAVPLRRQAGVRAFTVAVLAGFAYLTVLAATEHVRGSGFPFRYALVSVVLVVSAIAILATSSIGVALKPRWHSLLQAALLLGLLVGVTLRYGAPSYARARGIFDRKYGSVTSAVLEKRCTHILGDYWDVWGAVLHANLTQYESGAKQVVWGLTARSRDTRDLWFPLLDGGVVAVPRTQRSEAAWLQQAKGLGLPDLKLIQEAPEIRVYSAAGLGGYGDQRRTYGSSDMLISKCMKRASDGTIVGENCPSGALVFGPYVHVSKGATVRLTFEFQAEGKVRLVSDVVSGGGRTLHGAVDEQEIEANTPRAVGYRIHMFEDVEAAEARIAIRSDTLANFKISKFKLIVL